MTDTHRFPRLRIQEDDFPLQLPDAFSETFLEVVDANGEVVALFCLVDAVEKREFTTLAEFAQYYDELFFQHREDEAWALTANIERCAYPRASQSGNIVYKDLDLTTLIKGLSAYGRLRYAWGLTNESARKMYDGFLDTQFLADLLQYALSDPYEKYQDDLVEIFLFLFDLWGGRATYLHFFSIFADFEATFRVVYGEYVTLLNDLNVIDIEAFVKLDIDIIKPMASVLFRDYNINLFIQASVRMNNKGVEEYLENYQRIYFGYYLYGCERKRILESEISCVFPDSFFDIPKEIIDLNGKVILANYDNNYYIHSSHWIIEIITDAGNTLALFHSSMDFIYMWFPDTLAFTRYYDDISADTWEQQYDMDYHDFLLWNFSLGENNHYEKYIQMMRNHKVSSKREYCELEHLEDVGGDYDPTLEANDLLITFGRLKYPYFLDEVARSKYKDRAADHLFTLLLEKLYGDVDESDDNDFEDKVEILKFFMDFCKQEGMSYVERVDQFFVDWIHYDYRSNKMQDFVYLIENVFHGEMKEMMDPLFEAAHEAQNVEVLAYLLEYSNKHFPPQGTAHLKLEP